MSEGKDVLYRIKDWDQHFENNRSRSRPHCAWVPIPNKQDGDGYRTLISLPDGIALYGAWMAIVLVASKCRPERGLLLRGTGEPHSACTIARKSGAPEDVIQRALNVLSARGGDDEIGWIEALEYDPDTGRHKGAGVPHTSDLEMNRIERIERIEVIARIVQYLNSKSGKRFKSTNPATVLLVGDRLDEGYSEADFTAVIDSKVAEWKTNEKMHGFLRPKTLFGDNFEGYLQAAGTDPGPDKIKVRCKACAKLPTVEAMKCTECNGTGEVWEDAI